MLKVVSCRARLGGLIASVVHVHPGHIHQADSAIASNVLVLGCRCEIRDGVGLMYKLFAELALRRHVAKSIRAVLSDVEVLLLAKLNGGLHGALRGKALRVRVMHCPTRQSFCAVQFGFLGLQRVFVLGDVVDLGGCSWVGRYLSGLKQREQYNRGPGMVPLGSSGTVFAAFSVGRGLKIESRSCGGSRER